MTRFQHNGGNGPAALKTVVSANAKTLRGLGYAAVGQSSCCDDPDCCPPGCCDDGDCPSGCC